MKHQLNPTSATPRATLAAALAAALLSLPAAPIRGQSHPCGAVPANPPQESWSFLGPLAINNGQTDDERTMVNGRINGVAVNPYAPDSDIWVATAGGGVWHFEPSESPLDQWTPMTDDQESLATGALALDSCTVDRCATVWVGGGENSIRRDTQYGAGVLRGRFNPGTGDYDWAQLGAEHFRFGNISALVHDYSTPDDDQKTLYVGLTSGVTANATHSTVTTHPAGAYGIWKSTDAGASWSMIFNLPGARAADLEIDPQDPQTLYASFERQGLWRTTDGGAIWLPINNGIEAEFVDNASWPELEVYRPASAPAVLYVTMVGEGGCPPPHNFGGSPGCNPALFRSADGGNSWQKVHDKGGDLVVYETYTRALAIHPSNPYRLWFGGVGFSESGNAGENWTTHYGAHWDHHDIEIWEDPAALGGVRMVVVGDGGIYLVDGAGDWDDSLQLGLGVALFQSISSNPFTEHLIGGLQDNGTNYFMIDHLIWEHINDGDAASTIMDSDDPSTFYDIYIGNQPRRCTDAPFGCGYKTWDDITSGLGGGAVAFYPPMLEDPTAIFGPQHPLYFGNQKVRHSLDDGSSWGAVSPLSLAGPLPPPFFEDINSTNVITAIAPAPTDRAWLYVGFYDGRLYRSTDADQSSPTWTRLDNNGIGLPDRPISSIAVHPASREEIYVAFNGFGAHSVYRSLDAGVTWQIWDQTVDNSTVLAERPANRLAIEPEPPYRVWLGTDSCVYSRSSELLGGDWQYAGQGLPNVAAYDFEIDTDRERIYAGTHGRGVWMRDLGDAESGLIKLFNWEKCCAFWIDTGDPPGPPLHDPAQYVSISAVALEPEADCTLTLEALDGGVCTEASADADGATLRTDQHGALVADKEGFYTGKPAAWACYAGGCAGGVPADDCELASVTVRCGESEARSDAVAPKVKAGPGSALLALTPTLARGEGSVALTPTLAKAGEASKALCSVEATFDQSTTPAALLAALATAVDRDGGCIAAGVTAEVLDPEPSEGEDSGPGQPALRLSGAALEGSQLVPAITDAAGVRVELRGLGLPQYGQPVAPRLSLQTPEGAAGGLLRVTEVTPFGRCAMEVTTERGDDETVIAARLQDRFLASPEEDPEAAASCPGHRNPRDAARRGASMQFPVAHGLVVETDDPGLVFRLDSQ